MSSYISISFWRRIFSRKMGLTPHIDNLEKILAHILSQQADDIARKSTQEKAGKSVLKVTEEEVVKEGVQLQGM